MFNGLKWLAAATALKTAVCAFALTGVVFFAGCGNGGGGNGSGGGNKPAALIGHWVREYKDCKEGWWGQKECKDKTENMQLFKDGIGMLWGEGGFTWKIENKRLIILSPLMAMSYDYQISGYELTLVDNDNDTTIYLRKEKLEEYKAKQVAIEQAIERGKEAIRNNNYDEAIAAFSEAIRLNPQNEEFYNHRGYAYLGKEDYNKAIADFNEAIRLSPNPGRYYDSRGDAYRAEKEYDKAIEDYTKALQLDPKLEVSYNNRGDCYMEIKEYDKAIADFELIVRSQPSDAGEGLLGAIYGITLDKTQFERAKRSLAHVKLLKEHGI